MPDSNHSRLPGIVFDLDGTLIHSTIDFLLMRRMTMDRMRQAGVPERVLDGQKSIANNLSACHRYLSDIGSEEAARSLLSDAGTIMDDIEMRHVRHTKEVPGATETLRHLIDKGYLLVVLTRGSRNYTEAALTASGLANYLERTVCRDDYPDEEAKPNPISLVRAARQLRLTSGECILVGDHMMDLECARSAGSRFVGVLSGATDLPTWTMLGVGEIIPDVSHLPDLIARMA
jgi:phosphoglycolate phosphatase-like HAD superfamily hydrolase